MSEWKGDYRYQSLTVGRVHASAWDDGAMLVNASELEQRTGSMDAAKSAAEQALREMHDALVAHFAPVLRWTAGADGARGELKELGWELWAYEGGYTLRNKRTGIEGRWIAFASIDANRRDAQDALRSLGVAFRVEGE